MPQNGTLHVYFYDAKRYNAMIEKTKQQRKSSLDTLIEELDEINTRLGLPKPVWGELDPTRHRMIVRMPRKKKV